MHMKQQHKPSAVHARTCTLQVALFFARGVAVTMFRQGDDVAQLVGCYCRALIPGMWPLVGVGALCLA